MLPGFSIVNKISETAHVLFCRAIRESDKHAVLLKILRDDFPSSEQIANLEAEHTILRESAGIGIPRALDFIRHGNGRVLVLDSPAGELLSGHMGSLTQDEKLRVAEGLTQALANLQSKGIIFRDLRPDNVAHDRKTGRVTLMDFGLARRRSKISPGSALEGELAYLSPEATGRTQNAIDYRSDYYSLGVVLYELFSGQKPHTARDQMEWVHAHIAVTEMPLHKVVADFPQNLSRVVQKLMRKAPDQRYQSALGILADLRALRQNPNTENFEPGANDVSAKFRLSAKLYGREREIKIVNKVLTRVVLGEKRLILVSGDPGIGKSSLVNIMREQATAANGYFVFGKFDQYRKDVPFSALIHAFNQLVAQILTESEKSVAEWREKILFAMGENAAVVTAILPRVELIIGKCPPVNPLQTQESRQRFQQTFHAFIRACCTRGRPLVIFLDDLQWADSASRSLIQMFLTEKNAESLLFIGAYRDNEVTATHPLNELMRELDDQRVSREAIHLTSLTDENVRELIHDSFQMESETEARLADLVFAKTGGNPFFISQFLRMLFDKGYLHFHPYTGWGCDLAAIRDQDVTSNVLTLLGQKISSLAQDQQATIELAACFGNYFKLSELKTYDTRSEAEIQASLEAAVAGGLIIRIDADNYKFIHDRVQEAAYSMMSVEKRIDVHWGIARRLLQEWSLEKRHDGIFYLVNHWNAGSINARTLAERQMGAALNLSAAIRARESSVYDLALNYSIAGLALFHDEEWDANVDVLAPLTQLRATCEYTIGRNQEAEATFHSLLRKTDDPIGKARIYRTMSDLAHVKGHNPEALAWVLKGFEALNIYMPLHPSRLRLLFLILRNRSLQRKVMNSGVKEAMQIRDPRTYEIVQLLYAAAAPAYTLNKQFLAYGVLRTVLLSLKGGFLAFNARCYFTTILWSQLGDFAEAKRSDEYINEVLINAEPTNIDSRSYFVHGGFSHHILGTFKESIRVLEKGNHYLSLNGDVLYSANCLLHAGVQTILSERTLKDAEAKVDKYYDGVIKLNYPIMMASFLSVRYLLAALNGRPTVSYEGRELSPQLVEDTVTRFNEPLPKAWFDHFQMFMDYFLGNYEAGFARIEASEASQKLAPFTAFAIAARAIRTLLRLKYLERQSGLKKWKMHWLIRREIKFFRKLSEVNPTNFRSVYLILLGQYDVAHGNLQRAVSSLQEAISLAKAGEVVMWEGIANELLAEVFFSQRLEKVGMLCIREALFVYENWGAGAKVDQVLKRFPELNLISAVPGQANSAPVQGLDMDTVLKATNTLMSEIDMTRLVQKMLSILMENAGAERAVLFLNDGHQLVARGELSVHSSKAIELQATPFDSFLNVPRAMITYALRTHEPMVLESATEDDRLGRDEYVKQYRVLSAVALPIIGQGEVRGVVYLENNAAKGVFSPQRVEMMQVLSGQIAISLENARLYQQQAEAIRMQNELVTAHAVQEMLFPSANLSVPGANVSGFYQPATECGGDWWFHSQIGDWVYVWIGDATGHGAPAALVTSAACSAVALLENDPTLTPEKAMESLNKAVYRTTKGQINMTFFVAALNRLTGELRYVRASHEAPLLLRKDKHASTSVRSALVPLMGVNGASLGESADESYTATSVQLQPGDRVVLYTDGLPDLTSKDGQQLGERGLWDLAFQSINKGQTVVQSTEAMNAKAQEFRAGRELLDDITLCLLEYTGEARDSGKTAA